MVSLDDHDNLTGWRRYRQSQRMTPADKQFRTKPAVAADSIRADILRLFFDAR